MTCTLTQPKKDYEALSTSFVSALKHWKPQHMSFLDLSGENRNHICNLLIPDTSGLCTELVDLNPSLPAALPVVAFMFTCKEIQRELLPLYLRTINLRLCYNDPQSPAQCFEKKTSKLLKAYEAMDPVIADHLHSLRLYSSSLECIIQVTNSRAVHAEFFHEQPWIPPKALSTEIANQIGDRLANSPTGLLGIRHLTIAHQIISQIDEWLEWIDEEKLRNIKKMRDVPWHSSYSCGCCAAYKKYLVKRAEEEGMPRLILATTSKQDGAEMYD